MKTRDLIRACDDAGLRPKRVCDHLWMCVCPACWPWELGGRWLMIVGDEWPDVTCPNLRCPTNSPEAKADTRDQVRATIHRQPVVDRTSAWSHLARHLGVDVLARIIQQAPHTTENRADFITDLNTGPRTEQTALPSIRPPRIPIPV